MHAMLRHPRRLLNNNVVQVGNICYSLTLLLSIVFFTVNVNGFHNNIISKLQISSISSISSSSSTSSSLNSYFDSSSNYFLKRNIEIPLVDFSKIISNNEEDENKENIMNDVSLIPLPSNDLPDEVSTLNLYAYKLKGAAYERLLEKVESKNVKQLGMLISKGTDVSFYIVFMDINYNYTLTKAFTILIFFIMCTI